MSETETALDGFKSFVVRTENIAKELITTAGRYGVKASELDFNLLDVQTFLSEDESDKRGEEIFADELEKLNDPTLMSNPNVTIRQSYEVEIIVADKEDKFSRLNLSIGANPSMTKLFASIKPGSYLEYYDGIADDLREYINKRKLRANMLIYIWDEKLIEEIEKFIAKVQIAEKIEFEKRITFEVGHALEPVETIDDKLILHYEKDSKQDVDSIEKVDYAKRGFVQGVEENELLIEYIKPKLGKPGRNCRGAFIAPKEPVVSNTPTFSVTDKIEVIDTEDSIEYRAKHSGYIVFENNTYDIRVEVEVSEISFKSTGSIEAGINTDVSINVKESDPYKDAIAEGMIVEANEINVDGNIGNNTKLKALSVNIGGQTHQSSFIEGDEVNIKIHKGKVRGKKVKVERLEQGVIEADIAEVSQAIGGKIIAKEVLIDTIFSHVEVTASSKIEINSFRGGENSFTISSILYDEDRDDFKESEKEIVKQKRKIRILKEEIDRDKAILNDNASAIIDLKKRLAHYKKSGVEMPTSFVNKFKEFQELQKHVISLEKELKQDEDMLELISAKIKEFQTDVFKAKVINNDIYEGHNEIKFKLIDPELELLLVPKGRPGENCFKLEQNEESGAYEIVECLRKKSEADEEQNEDKNEEKD